MILPPEVVDFIDALSRRLEAALAETRSFGAGWDWTACNSFETAFERRV